MERGVLKRRMHRGASLHFDCRNRIPKRPEDRNPSASSPAGGALTGALRPQGWIWVEMSACHCLNPRRHSFRGLRWRCGWRSRPRGSSSGRSSDSLLPFVGSGNAFPAPLSDGAPVALLTVEPDRGPPAIFLRGIGAMLPPERHRAWRGQRQSTQQRDCRGFSPRSLFNLLLGAGFGHPVNLVAPKVRKIPIPASINHKICDFRDTALSFKKVLFFQKT